MEVAHSIPLELSALDFVSHFLARVFPVLEDGVASSIRVRLGIRGLPFVSNAATSFFPPRFILLLGVLGLRSPAGVVNVHCYELNPILCY